MKCLTARDLSKWRLATANDFTGTNNFVPKPFQNFDHAVAARGKGASTKRGMNSVSVTRKN